MTLASPTLGAEFRPLRFALRELRGGLHGFRIFVACIALGVMAIAGVGSFSRSLTDGLARDGRVILGGDLAFTLIHREANEEERKFLDARGQVSVGAMLRAMARTGDGRQALVELKAVDGAYPLYGAVTLDPAMPLAGALAPRDGAFGAAVDATLLARLDLKPGARLTVGDATIEIAAILQNEPDKLASGSGVRPPRDGERRGVARDRPAGARQSRALELPPAAAGWQRPRRQRASIAAARRRLPDAGWQIRGRTNATPALGAQHRAFHPVPDPGRPHRAAGRRGRRRQCGEEPHRPEARRDRDPEGARRVRRPGVRDLSLAGDAAGRDRHGDRARLRRDAAVRHRGGVRRHHAAADRAGAACRSNCRWRSSMACSRRSPSRSGRSAAPTTCRSRRCFAMRSRPNAAGRAGAMSSLAALVVALLAAIAVMLAYDRKIAAIFIAAAAARVRRCCGSSPC